MVLIEINNETELDFYRANYPYLIVMFTAEYSEKCRVMKPEFQKRSDIYPRKVFLLVNCQKVLKHGFELHAIPTFVKYSHGSVLESFVGDDCGKLDEMLNNMKISEGSETSIEARRSHSKLEKREQRAKLDK